MRTQQSILWGTSLFVFHSGQKVTVFHCLKAKLILHGWCLIYWWALSWNNETIYVTSGGFVLSEAICIISKIGLMRLYYSQCMLLIAMVCEITSLYSTLLKKRVHQDVKFCKAIKKNIFKMCNNMNCMNCNLKSHNHLTIPSFKHVIVVHRNHFWPFTTYNDF